VESETKVSVKHTLTLNDTEAMWLRDLIQNPLHEEETVQDMQMRGMIWDALGGSRKKL